jgi:hypothetical protein
MSELVEVLKNARTLKSQIEILSRCKLSKQEKTILHTVLRELNTLTTHYLEGDE